MNTERLSLLAKHLRNVDATHFNLYSWGAVDNEAEQLDISDEDELPKQVVARGVQLIKEGACGTTACAVGHACCVPEFQAQGLRWSANMLTPEYAGETSWAAVEEFFGLSYLNAQLLFSHTKYDTGLKTTPTQVAERIEDFILIAND